jgi:hypothetical protein
MLFKPVQFFQKYTKSPEAERPFSNSNRARETEEVTPMLN